MADEGTRTAVGDQLVGAVRFSLSGQGARHAILDLREESGGAVWERATPMEIAVALALACRTDGRPDSRLSAIPYALPPNNPVLGRSECRDDIAGALYCQQMRRYAANVARQSGDNIFRDDEFDISAEFSAGGIATVSGPFLLPEDEFSERLYKGFPAESLPELDEHGRKAVYRYKFKQNGGGGGPTAEYLIQESKEWFDGEASSAGETKLTTEFIGTKFAITRRYVALSLLLRTLPDVETMRNWCEETLADVLSTIFARFPETRQYRGDVFSERGGRVLKSPAPDATAGGLAARHLLAENEDGDEPGAPFRWRVRPPEDWKDSAAGLLVALDARRLARNLPATHSAPVGKCLDFDMVQDLMVNHRIEPILGVLNLTRRVDPAFPDLLFPKAGDPDPLEITSASLYANVALVCQSLVEDGEFAALGIGMGDAAAALLGSDAFLERSPGTVFFDGIDEGSNGDDRGGWNSRARDPGQAIGRVNALVEGLRESAKDHVKQTPMKDSYFRTETFTSFDGVETGGAHLLDAFAAAVGIAVESSRFPQRPFASAKEKNRLNQERDETNERLLRTALRCWVYRNRMQVPDAEALFERLFGVPPSRKPGQLAKVRRVFY